MSVLDSVLKYKAEKEAQEAQAYQAIPNAIAGFIQGRQQQIENQKSMLDTQISAAKAGYRIQNGQLIADPQMQENAQKNTWFMDENGNLSLSGAVGSRDIVKQLPQSVEQIKEKAIARGEASIETGQKELATKLGGYTKKLDYLQNEYTAALDDVSKDIPEWQQRLVGPLEVLGAKTGAKPNPRLMALKKNEKMQAIQLVRMAGEVGNLTGQEQQNALDSVAQETLTPEERVAAVKQQVEFALSGATDSARKYLMKDKSFQRVAERYGISVDGMTSDDSSNDASSESGSSSNKALPKFDPSKERLQRNKTTGEYRVVPK